MRRRYWFEVEVKNPTNEVRGEVSADSKHEAKEKARKIAKFHFPNGKFGDVKVSQI